MSPAWRAWLRRVPAIAADWAYALRQQTRALVARGRPDEFWTVADMPCGRVPVVLLPGIWEPYRFLRPLTQALHAAGHPVYPVAALGWNGADLERSTDRVIAHLLERDLHDVVLVAHSKGGLIGKKVLLDARVADRVLGLVAVCSPFGGSSLSFGFLARTPLGMFAPTGAVIAALAGETRVHDRITSLSPVWDEMVPEGSRLPGARNRELPVAGHFRALADPVCQAIVHDEVDALVASRGDVAAASAHE